MVAVLSTEAGYNSCNFPMGANGISYQVSKAPIMIDMQMGDNNVVDRQSGREPGGDGIPNIPPDLGSRSFPLTIDKYGTGIPDRLTGKSIGSGGIHSKQECRIPHHRYRYGEFQENGLRRRWLPGDRKKNEQ